MEVTIGTKVYPIGWDNRALHDFGRACGATNMTQIQSLMLELSNAFQDRESAQSLDVFDKLVKMGMCSLQAGAAREGVDLDISERELYNKALDNPEILGSVFQTMIDASPKPREEDKELQKKNTKDDQ